MADAPALGAGARKGVRVRLPPPAPDFATYIIYVAKFVRRSFMRSWTRYYRVLRLADAINVCGA